MEGMGTKQIFANFQGSFGSCDSGGIFAENSMCFSFRVPRSVRAGVII